MEGIIIHEIALRSERIDITGLAYGISGHFSGSVRAEVGGRYITISLDSDQAVRLSKCASEMVGAALESLTSEEAR